MAGAPAPIGVPAAVSPGLCLMARGTRCNAHRHTSVVAEENHHLRPQSRGGPNTAANMRYLCANAHGDAHYLLDLIEKHAKTLIGTPGAVPSDPVDMIAWPVLRTYGPGVRRAAFDGWSQYGAAFLAGEYRRHAALWSTSGQPLGDISQYDGDGRHTGPAPYSVAAARGEVGYWLSIAGLNLAAEQAGR